MSGYAVGRAASDGASYVLVPLADLQVIYILLGVIDDIEFGDEHEVVQRVESTIRNNQPKESK